MGGNFSVQQAESQGKRVQQQLDRAIQRMMSTTSYHETKQLVVLVRNGCGTAFATYIKALSPHFNILVPDDGVLDTRPRNDAINMVPKLIGMALAQNPKLILTNSRGVGYAYQALKCADQSVSCRIAVLVLSSGDRRGPNLLEEHPGRVVCLHGRYDECTPIRNLRNAFGNRQRKKLEAATLFTIMNRGHQKRHGWELGGLARWVLRDQQIQDQDQDGDLLLPAQGLCQCQQIQSSHECIYFPDDWPSSQEQANWRAWFRNVCQADPDHYQTVNNWGNG
mmetsp:Transcript_69953/g.134994  ORF Transcript_69953/g.134994 Transcript_69953/m.134994 type:complete len:279 (-) Transcript_69953:457-1293(-)